MNIERPTSNEETEGSMFIHAWPTSALCPLPSLLCPLSSALWTSALSRYSLPAQIGLLDIGVAGKICGATLQNETSVLQHISPC